MLRRLLLLALLALLSSPAFSQVVTEGTASAVDTTTVNPGPVVASSFAMPANTETLLVFFGLNANVVATPVATWNTSESLTLVGTTTFSGSGADTGVWALCLQSPTVTTANISVDWNPGSTNAAWMTIHALSGTSGASCATAITELAEDVDDAAASLTSVFGSAGAAGNEGFIASSLIGGDGTATNSAGWTEAPAEGNTGGGAGTNEDLSFNVSSGDLPAANTITWSIEDEHASLYMSVAVAPTFDVNPALSAATDSTITISYDAAATADNLQCMATDTAAAAPTAAQIEAQTGSHGYATEATTGAADSLLVTIADAPEFPLYDVHCVLEEGISNYSSVVTVPDVAMDAPLGFQFVAITSVGVGSPVEAFNSAVDPDIASGDYLLAPVAVSPGISDTHTGANNAATLTDGTATWVDDAFINSVVENDTDGSFCTITDNTATTIVCTLSGGAENDWDSGEGYTVLPDLTIGADGQFSYPGDGSRQSATNIPVYDATAGAYHASDIDFWDNNATPVCGDEETIVFDEDVAITQINLDTDCTDADADALSFTITGTLPSGVTQGVAPNDNLLNGTPITENETGVNITFTAADVAEAEAVFIKLLYVVNTWTMPDITGLDLTSAFNTVIAAAPWHENLSLGATTQCHASVAANTIITQNPLALAEVDDPFQAVTVTVSTGPCGRQLITSFIATAVPSTAVFIAGTAHAQAGGRYVADCAGQSTVHLRGILHRQDGAMCIDTVDDVDLDINGYGVNQAGEVIADTCTGVFFPQRIPRDASGSVCMTDIN